MVNLRHINGDSLITLEKQLKNIKLPIVVHTIQKVGNNWYIHFLVQGIPEAEFGISKQTTKKTKTVKTKKT